MKKIWKFLGSMRFAIILLVILAAACAGGSFITQGLSFDEYKALYSERAAGLIVGLGLDDVFHAWWFLTLTAFLCGNLLLCNLLRLPQLRKRTKDAADPAKAGVPAVTLEGIADPDALLAKLRMPRAVESRDAEGRPLRFSVQNRIGLWGAWVCHLGILLLILGFALGQMTKEEYTVYGVPGEVKQIGETDYQLYIRDFRIDRNGDGSVEQYASELTVLNCADESDILAQDTTASVNHPGSAFGFKLYQNSTGDAAKLTIGTEAGEAREKWLCAGEVIALKQDGSVSISLKGCDPAYAAAEDGSAVPGYSYLVSIGSQVYQGLQAEGERIPALLPNEVCFTEAGSYTLIQIKRDRFTPLALLGGLITLLGLFLAFYLQTRKVWAVQTEDGAWTVHGSSPKGGALFAERVKEAAASL